MEAKDLRDRCCGRRPHRGVPRVCSRDLGDRAHANRVVIAAGHQRRSGRRAHRRRVEAGVAESASGEPIGGGHLTRPTEGRGCPESHVVDQHDEDVRCPIGCPDLLRKLPVSGVTERFAEVMTFPVVDVERHVHPVLSRYPWHRCTQQLDEHPRTVGDAQVETLRSGFLPTARSPPHSEGRSRSTVLSRRRRRRARARQSWPRAVLICS